MRRAVFLLLVAIAMAGTAIAADRLPFTVDVQMHLGAEPGSESLREALEREVLTELNARGCFRDFRPAADPEERPPAPLLLELTIAGVVEETRYEQSQAERMNPTDAVGTALGYVEVVEATIGVRLAVTSASTTLRQDAFRRTVARRPMTMTENARERAREDFAREIARRARAFACKGSEARLEREIRSLLEAAQR